MILPKIALRNLSRQKRRSFLLGGALSFGMFILVVVNGLAGGLLSSIQKNFGDLISGHIFFLQIEKDENGRVINLTRDDSAFLEKMKEAGIAYKSVSRQTSVYSSVLYNGESSQRAVTGVNWEEEKDFGKGLTMIAGSPDGMANTDGILISMALAERLKLVPKKKLAYADAANLKRELKIQWKKDGKSWNLDKKVQAETKRIEAENKAKQLELAPSILGEELLVQLDTIHGQKNVASFRIKGIFDAQMDYAAYVDRETLNGYAEMPAGSFNMTAVKLKNVSGLDQKTIIVQSLLKDKYDLVPYSKIAGRSANVIIGDVKKEGFTGQKTIITNLNNELGSIVGILNGIQAGCFVLFVIILAVVMVGLVNTFRIVVYERTKEIGTMRAVGTQRSQIKNLFLLEAGFLGFAGTIPGTALGFIVLNVITLFRLDSMAEMALFLNNGHLQYTVSLGMLVGSIAIVIAFTLLAALIPARRAAKMEPAQALRTQF
ncbi:MAG TPA: FtsX-like permease family protein [Treponemataceae bacterium]|nr:FtsX-like permease family protein [Treponemataceae bacterium]